MTEKVGLTGGIGSGKSEVGKQFRQLGVTVIDADEVARKVTAAGTPALVKIRQRFGEECLLADGNLNRKALGEIIFGNADERKWLEHLLHPLIRQESDIQADQVDAPYCILEIPLLIETGRHRDMAAVIVAHCDKNIRRERLIAIRKMDAETIERIFDSQASDEERLKQADYVIDNNGPVTALRNQVSDIHRQLLERFSSN